MSTAPEKPLDLAGLVDSLGQASQPDPKDETIAELEGRLQDVGNKLYEERFLWILVCLALFDALVFMSMGNWTGPVVIGIIEIIGVVILADRCRVNTVAPLIDRITGLVHRAANTDRDP